jgi:hypothetical protein
LYAGERENFSKNAGYLNLVLPVEVLAGGRLSHDHGHGFPPDRTADRETPEKGRSTMETVAFTEP